METLEYILNRLQVVPAERGYTEIPNFGRDNLAELFGDLGFRVGVEIGVEQGLYSEVLCRSIPSLHLYCVDAWSAYAGYRDHVGEEKLESFFEATKERLANYDVSFIRKFSMDAVMDFQDESLDFVYIDANHELPWIIDDIFHWDKKVKPGGIVSGHDYYRSKRLYTKCHVKYAVDCYTEAFRIKPWFILGRQAKIPGEVRDTSRSWMWVKRPIEYGEYMHYARE
jgi:hypothetical protein